MKQRFYFLLVILLVIFSGCATMPTQDPTLTKPIGTTYKGIVSFNNMDIPLPEGEWVVIGRGIQNDLRFYEMILFNKKSEDLINLVRDAPSNISRGYVHSDYLARSDVHHTVVKNNNRGEAQDGWLINHYLLVIDNRHGQASKEAREYLTKNNYAFPGNYIEVHHRFAGNRIQPSKYLVYNHFYNPETDGFDPPSNSDWGSSDWHPLKINNDPKKKVYIEKLKEEGETFHAKLKNVFEKVQ